MFESEDIDVLNEKILKINKDSDMLDLIKDNDKLCEYYGSHIVPKLLCLCIKKQFSNTFEYLKLKDMKRYRSAICAQFIMENISIREYLGESFGIGNDTLTYMKIEVEYLERYVKETSLETLRDNIVKGKISVSSPEVMNWINCNFYLSKKHMWSIVSYDITDIDRIRELYSLLPDIGSNDFIKFLEYASHNNLNLLEYIVEERYPHLKNIVLRELLESYYYGMWTEEASTDFEFTYCCFKMGFDLEDVVYLQMASGAFYIYCVEPHELVESIISLFKDFSRKYKVNKTTPSIKFLDDVKYCTNIPENQDPKEFTYVIKKKIKLMINCSDDYKKIREISDDINRMYADE